MKKDKLNVLLYKAQIHAALEWGSFWHMIQDTIINSIHIKFADVYRTLDRKLFQLTHNPSVTTRSKHKFFQMVTNLTKINFTDEEISISVVLTYLDLCMFQHSVMHPCKFICHKFTLTACQRDQDLVGFMLRKWLRVYAIQQVFGSIKGYVLMARSTFKHS